MDPDTTPHDRAVEDPLAEVRKIRETSERMANGDYPHEADDTRVLAGMIHQLAEQIERLSDSVGAHRPAGAGENTAIDPSTYPPARVDRETEIETQEDRTPETPPAEPLDDRSKV